MKHLLIVITVSMIILSLSSCGMPTKSGNVIEKENEIVDNSDDEVKDESEEQSESTNYDKIYEFLKKQSEATFSKYYELIDFKISDYNEEQIDNTVEAKLKYCIIHKNFDKDPDQVQYIKEAKEKNDPNYQKLYDEYLMPKEMNMYLKVIINQDGDITLFTDENPHTGEEWVEFKMSDCIISD